jgi:hypothetical protein
LLAWFPSRSRKLLPKFTTVDPDETLELIVVGVGDGVGVGEGEGVGVRDGEGVGIGVGEGVGDGVKVGDGDGLCATAEVDAAPAVTARMNAIAIVLASLRPAPVLFAREGRDEQHMNAIPKNERQLDKSRKKITRSGGFAPVSPGGSIAPAPLRRGNAGHCGSAATGRSMLSLLVLDF